MIKEMTGNDDQRHCYREEHDKARAAVGKRWRDKRRKPTLEEKQRNMERMWNELRAKGIVK